MVSEISIDGISELEGSHTRAVEVSNVILLARTFRSVSSYIRDSKLDHANELKRASMRRRFAFRVLKAIRPADDEGITGESWRAAANPT